jgi:hypothetical protein
VKVREWVQQFVSCRSRSAANMPIPILYLVETSLTLKDGLKREVSTAEGQELARTLNMQFVQVASEVDMRKRIVETAKVLRRVRYMTRDLPCRSQPRVWLFEALVNAIWPQREARRFDSHWTFDSLVRSPPRTSSLRILVKDIAVGPPTELKEWLSKKYYSRNAKANVSCRRSIHVVRD